VGSDRAGRQRSEAAQPLSKKQFSERAGAICTRLKSSVAKLRRGYVFGGTEGVANMSKFAAKAAPQVRGALEQLRGLGAPRSERAKNAAFLDQAEQGAAELERASTSASTARVLLRGRDPFVRAEALARRAGLRGCVIAP
jgi:hypothetical protein